MYYNTITFGNSIRDIRKKLELTQKDVADMTGINENTMRRLENGKVLPKQETLDLLSVVYKQDISQVFLACRMDGFEDYSYIIEEIERAFEASNPQQLKSCLEILLRLSTSDMSHFYKNLIQQTICLIDAGIALLDQNDPNASYLNLVNGLKITIDDFAYSNYKNHIYSKIELQLLMNLAITENRRNNIDISLDLLDFCVFLVENNIEFKKSILPTKIYLNASYMNYLCNAFDRSLHFAIRGIEYNNSIRSQYAIGHLYARKGFAELNLKSDAHLASFKKAYFYHDVLGQEDLKTLLVTILKERKGIDLLQFI